MSNGWLYKTFMVFYVFESIKNLRLFPPRDKIQERILLHADNVDDSLFNFVWLIEVKLYPGYNWVVI